jgi:hypothetical protein
MVLYAVSLGVTLQEESRAALTRLLIVRELPVRRRLLDEDEDIFITLHQVQRVGYTVLYLVYYTIYQYLVPGYVPVTRPVLPDYSISEFYW